jgi:hypothetical protein
LSASITFKHIKEQAFQVKRDDCNLDGMDGMEVIRVSLAAAVHFVTTLQQREDAAVPGEMADAIENFFCPPDYPVNYENFSLSADVWAEKILK